MLREHRARSSVRRRSDRRARCAAARAPPRPATRPGRPDRRRPCRCRARASSSRRCRASCPSLEHLLDLLSLLASDRAVVRAHQRLAGQLVQPCCASRSHRRRLLANTIVERCARTSSSSRGWIAGHMPWRSSAGRSSARLGGATLGASGGSPCPRPAPRWSGRARGGSPASTIVTGRGSPCMPPPRKRAISSSGRCVADRPMRCGSRAGRARPAARARAPGARRAWSAPARGSRRR